MAKTPSANSISLVKSGPGWLPADAHAERFGQKYKDGDELVLDVHGISNPKKARFMFQLCRKVVEAGSPYENPNELREALLIESGFYRWHHLFAGTGLERRLQRPMSFTELSDEQFDFLISNSKKILAEHYGINVDDIMRKDDGTQPWSGPLPWQEGGRGLEPPADDGDPGWQPDF